MSRRGFTMVEALVVLAVVALSLALALPAIQNAIQDAHRAQCANNLKQIALAMHNYHDAFSVFPPGWISREGAPGLGARVGWQTFLLPFVDQVRLYNEINFSLTSPVSPDGQPLPLFQTTLGVYRCPADPSPDPNPLRGDYATSNYSGNYGHIPAPRLRPLGLSDFWPGATQAPMRSRGIFARNSRVGIRDIVDGTSNTFLVGERCVTSGAGIWPGVTDNGHEDDAVTDGSHRSRPNAGWNSWSSR